MNLHFCTRSLRQIKHTLPKSRIQLSSHVEKCTKLSAVALSQAAIKKPHHQVKDVERNEVLLIKNLLAGNKLETEMTTKESLQSYQNIAMVEKRPCTSESGHCNYKNQLVWQDVLLGAKHSGRQDQILKEYSNLIGVSHEMWYCTNIDVACPKKNLLNESYVEFSTMDRVQCIKVQQNTSADRKTSSGPSPEQLSLVLLRLREEIPNFFEGHHRYSIYSKDILFVNKLTRTTTRTLKSYKYIMKVMAYGGKLFWTKASLDILRITKHSEDNTIKVRWTAKGMPWYQLPFFLLSGKPQSLFYRYVDGFSIFEVGRDGLVHCHRLDKVIPTSTPERQKWSIRMQVLALLGLGEITHEPCEAFQVKSQEILK